MSIRIIVADRQPIARAGLRRLLEAHPEFEVVAEAATSEELTRICVDAKPDLILMDTSLGGVRGVDVIRLICPPDAHTRVIVISSQTERWNVADALAAGASGYLSKDCQMQELLTAVSAVMKGERFLGPMVASKFISGISRFSGEVAPLHESLSPREREVLHYLADGKSAKEIARALNLSNKTVESHRRHIMDKLSIYSVAELTRYAIREGIATL